MNRSLARTLAGSLLILTAGLAPLRAEPVPEYQTQPIVPSELKTAAQAAIDFFGEKKYPEAIRCYQEMLRKYPKLLYAWSNLGVVYYRQGSIESAESALRTALKLSPADVFSLNLLGLVLMQQDRYEEAVEPLQQAVALAPKDTRIALRLATALSVLNRDDEMRAVLKKALENNPAPDQPRDATPR